MVSAKTPTTRTDPKLRLAEYFLRADHMHQLVHYFLVEFKSINAIWAEGYDLEFSTYVSFWLSSLFVVIEGFNRLRLKDENINSILNHNVHSLKAFRDNTWHFATDMETSARFFEGNKLNWAEELHEAFRDYLGSYAYNLANKEVAASAIRKRA